MSDEYIPDVAAAYAHIRRLFDACDDGSGTLDASWVITVATKALEALSEGIASPAAAGPTLSDTPDGGRADPEPDVPENECTTAEILRKVATHLTTGAFAVTDAAISREEWIIGLSKRAYLLERRVAPTPPTAPASEGAVAIKVTCPNCGLEEVRRLYGATGNAYECTCGERWRERIPPSVRATEIDAIVNHLRARLQHDTPASSIALRWLDRLAKLARRGGGEADTLDLQSDEMGPLIPEADLDELHRLTDLKLEGTLDEAGAVRLSALQAQFDEAEEKYYRPIADQNELDREMRMLFGSHTVSSYKRGVIRRMAITLNRLWESLGDEKRSTELLKLQLKVAKIVSARTPPASPAESLPPIVVSTDAAESRPPIVGDDEENKKG